VWKEGMKKERKKDKENKALERPQKQQQKEKVK
jgi:hypothetical protein